MIRKNAYLVTLALVSPTPNSRSRAQTLIFIIENQHFLVQMAPEASWPPDVSAESLEARSPQPGVLSQESSARLLRQESSARIPQPGFLSQESSARSPQPGFLRQESLARILQPGFLSQQSPANLFGVRAGVMFTLMGFSRLVKGLRKVTGTVVVHFDQKKAVLRDTCSRLA